MDFKLPEKERIMTGLANAVMGGINADASTISIPQIGYSEKSGTNSNAFVCYSDLSQDPKGFDSIFSEKGQVGIRRNPNGATSKDGGGYYKQYFYEMNRDWAFGCAVKFKESDSGMIPAAGQKYLFTFGGERSVFVLEFSENAPKGYSPEAASYSSPSSAVVLLSDTFLPSDVAMSLNAFLAETKPFRHIITDENTKHFYAMSGEKDDGSVPRKSKKRELFKAGSVFYSNQTENLIKRIEAYGGYRQIGFNHAIPVKSK
jgi:hypothetical protein